MIRRLFSIFDPISNFSLSINWITPTILLIIIPSYYWFVPNSFIIVFNKRATILHNEYKIILKYTKRNLLTLIFLIIFLIIIINNFIGLFPYIFTRTRHLTFNLTVAFPIWITLILFGWLKNTFHIFQHLVPQGTPILLIPFIVLIETTRILIRPITLTVRLTANIVAGHLLLTLLRKLGAILNLQYLPILLSVQVALLILEAAVAVIQSYVFATLIALYIREV